MSEYAFNCVMYFFRSFFRDLTFFSISTCEKVMMTLAEIKSNGQLCYCWILAPTSKTSVPPVQGHRNLMIIHVESYQSVQLIENNE